MSINKLALIRYKTIDLCLKNRARKWTLEDLMEACSDALYEYEGITNGVSRRTVQLDIQNMRSEKLGYNAPIIVTDKKFYTYEDKNFSITNSPITTQDLNTLNEVIHILRQFKGFGYFDELSSMITRLENKVFTHQNKGISYIQFEKNELLKGLEFIDPLYKSIINKQVVNIRYQSFKARAASNIKVSPYLLKEYRNRWFVVCKPQTSAQILNLALDRIVRVEELPDNTYLAPNFDISKYYDDTIGVTKSESQRPRKIILKIDHAHLPYILTKPLHPSQKIIKEELDGTLFSIEVIHNFELEREILGFGEFMQVVAPTNMKRLLQNRINKMGLRYSQNTKTDTDDPKD